MGKGDLELLHEALKDKKLMENVLWPLSPNDLPKSSEDRDWLFVLASTGSLNGLKKYGSHIVGLDGVWKLLRLFDQKKIM